MWGEGDFILSILELPNEKIKKELEKVKKRIAFFRCAGFSENNLFLSQNVYYLRCFRKVIEMRKIKRLWDEDEKDDNSD